jgi:hypothetical protein
MRVIIGVTAFLLIAVGAALCQRSEWNATSKALPDAPSAASNSGKLLDNSLPADLLSGPAIGAGTFEQKSVPLNDTYFTSARWSAAYREPKDTNDFFGRQIPALLRHSVSYHAVAGNSLAARATRAASNTFITRTPSGKAKLNTSYFLGVLSSAMIHTAYRPYWNRPVSAPFSDFGSTVGNDAGMNVLHAVGPQLEQLMKSHAPRFVSRIEQSIEHR